MLEFLKKGIDMMLEFIKTRHLRKIATKRGTNSRRKAETQLWQLELACVLVNIVIAYLQLSRR